MITESTGVVNIASVPHRSPFRYPGGKTWLVPKIRHWLRSRHRPTQLIEPFAGGGIVGLSALFDGLVDRALLAELDSEVAAVWKVMLSDEAPQLARDIESFVMSSQNAAHILGCHGETLVDQAFATILKNRVNRGGILAPGAGLMKSGENGQGLLSRWYPATIAQRVLAVSAIRERITFVEGDGLDVLRASAPDPAVAFFIDPPYTAAGKRLYTHATLNHAELFDAVAELRGDFLMTYDNAPEIAELARRHGFETSTVPMKSTHHECKYELLIARDLGWLSDRSSSHTA